MATVYPLRSNDAACWHEAVQLYNSRLKRGAYSKKYINLSTMENGEHGPKDHARELMATAINTYQKLTKKRGPFATAIIRIYSNLRQYARAIDIFIECDPAIASLVWGSIRVLLQIGEEEEQASRIAGEGIVEIVRHAGRWEQVSAVSDLLNSPRLKKALVALYVGVLDFLVSSSQWLKRGTLERLGTSVFGSKRDKFKEKLNEMRNNAELVDKELQTQAAYKGLGSLGEIGSDVHTVMHKLDTILDQVQHLSDHTSQLQRGNGSLAWDHENRNSTNVVLSELKSLPMLITDTILNQMQGALDLVRIRQWLILSNGGKLPPTSHVDGTCSWILQHPSFVKWTLSGERSVLWVQGHQGCGKSAMAGYLNGLLAAGGSKTLFYQFERSASATQSTPIAFAGSLIYQLLEKWTGSSPATGPYDQLQNLATQFPLGPQNCPFKILWSVVASLLKISEQQFNLVIDALDECLFDGPLQPSVSDFFDNLFELIRETGIKAVIFSRPEPMFTDAVQLGLSIFMTPDLLLPDVMTFAKSQYKQLGLPESEMDVILKFIRSSSHGSFRWSELYLRHLGQSLQVTDLHTRIRTSPPSINELYRQSLLNAAKTLSKNELECQRALLLAVFQAQRPLTTAEIADALGLRPDRADIIISSLCKPLASAYGGFFHLSHPSVREFFNLYYEANDNSLGISFSESHGLLAEKCLSCLLNERYADLKHIGSYLVANHDEKAHVSLNALPLEGSFYDYAYRFWDYHLVRTKVPSKDLLHKANSFVLSLQFAYWSECSRQDCGQLVRVVAAFSSLSSWHKGLSMEDKSLIELDKYFERAYSMLSTAFDSYKMDSVLPWLARVAMGKFYFIMVIPNKATLMREEALTGLQTLLGPRHHLTLHAKSDVAYVHLYAGKMRMSRRMYNEVLDIQREVLGERSLHFLETLNYKGQSEYYMADFMAAAITWTKTSAEFLGLLGPDSWQYLSAQLWYARSVTYMGEVDIGLRILQSVARKRYELFGPSDSFFNAVQMNVGEIQLLMGRYEESITTLQDVLEGRRSVLLPSNIFRLDAEITLAVAYQAAGMSQAALTIIKEIEEGPGDLRSEFERYCQIMHLKSLLLAEGGSLNEAITQLQTTILQAEEDQNNRALLWIRLDLATMLRNRDSEYDRAEASINFDKIVKDISGDYPGFPDEPDPPRLLAVAEKALRLVRSRKYAEARHELDSEHLDWRRPSDFWLWVGGSFYKDLLQITEPALGRTS